MIKLPAVFPILDTPRIKLDSLTIDDKDMVYAMRSDPGVMKYISRPLFTTKHDSELWISKVSEIFTTGAGITWAVRLKNSGVCIGTLGLWRFEHENYRAEIGYMLHPDFQGQGYMKEAIPVVLKYGFQALGVHSVEGIVSPGNVASAALLERFGFVKEGHFRENYFFDGQFLDSVIYSLLEKNMRY